MLALALKAHVPLVATHTTDAINAQLVLTYLAERPLTRPVRQFTPEMVKQIEPKDLYYCHGKIPESASFARLFAALESLGTTLVVVNPEPALDGAFDAGPLPVPRELLEQRLEAVGLDEAAVSDAMPALGGLTLTEAGWVLRLAMVRDHAVTRHTLARVRKECFPSRRGLAPVDTQELGYEPEPPLQAWIAREKHFFLKGKPIWVPRGLLFDGPPGTGKTAGAKYIAEQIGVPCWRLELGAVKGKYVGESEKAMLGVLREVDREGPCVFLVDEVEKLLAGRDDSSGVNQNLMADLLWWLAEHRTRVLTVMTSNDRARLAPELYRPGRVDAVITFAGLSRQEAGPFAARVLTRLGAKLPPTKVDLAVDDAFSDAESAGVQVQAAIGRCSQAAIKQAVIGAVKEHLAGKAATRQRQG